MTPCRIEGLGLPPERVQILRTVIEMSPDPMSLSLYENGCFLACNTAFEEAVGRSREELIGHTSIELGIFESEDARQTEAEKLASSGFEIQSDTRFRRGDGQVRRFHISARLLEEGGRKLVLAALRDMEDYLQLQDRLRQTERRFAVAFHHSTAFHALLDGHLQVLDLNTTACRFLGVRREEAIGRPFTELYDQSDPERPRLRRDSLEKLLAGETVSFSEEDARDTEVYFEGHFAPVFGDDGRVELVLASGIEVTDRVRLERELIDVAERERERIGHVLHDEIGQLLVGAGFGLDALRRALEGEALTELDRCREILNGAHQRLRYLSQGYALEIPEGVGIADALVGLAKVVRELFGIECRVDANDDFRDLRAEDVRALVFIAREAVTNAVHHGHAGEVRIRWRRSRTLARLEIEDDGQGMPGTEPEGFGLGTRIMRSRALQLDGTLRYQRGPTLGGVLVRVQFHRPAREARS